MGNAAAHMARGNMSGRIAYMAGLVVEEEIGLELAQSDYFKGFASSRGPFLYQIAQWCLIYIG